MAEVIGWHWMSCYRFTILVGCQDETIVECPPIARRFRGQKLVNLARWMRSLGGYKTCYLGTYEGGQ